MNLYQFKTQSSRAFRRTAAYLKVTLHLFGGVAFLWTSTVQANPVGEQVVAGAAGFERVGGALTITQGTDRAVINWNSFSIGAGEITKFVQPNSSSAVLNRVITANNPSAIYGTLQANGQVYLINPAGIFIGPGGLVDTASFVASTHDVGDKEFMGGGDLNFTGSSGASIVNQGRIEAKQGDVFLVARQVSNEGQIMASDGTVGMISGTEVCLHSIGPNNYKVRLIDVANDTGVKKTDNGIADVVNAGVIEAANAELESTGNYLSLAIKNTGVIRATGVVPNADGSVTLTGGEGDILNTGVVAAIQKNIQGETVGGRILASAKNITTDPGSIMTAAGTENGGEIRMAAKDTVYASGKVEAGSTAGKGGKVQVTGERVALIQAEVDVSGKSGGGTVLVGGDYLGKNPDVPNAKAVVMTSDSVIRANATENGDGGKVILWSDEYTGFYGEIFARGGIESGNGGFVETSSKDNLQAFGTVIASAVNGQGGLWLLDPANVLISAATTNGTFATGTFTPNNTGSATISNTDIQTSLNAGTSVTILTSSTGAGQTGNITMSAGIAKSSVTTGTTLTMIAAGSINISQNIVQSTPSAGTLTLVLGAVSNVTIRANITTNGGNLLIQGSNAAGGATAVSAGTVTLDGGAVDTGLGGNLSVVASGAIIQSGGTLTIGGTSTITTGGATISLTQANNNFVGAVSLTNTGNNAVAVTNANAIVLGTSSVGTGTLTVTSTTGITQAGGGITQAASAGAATFNGGAGVITLDQANNFSGAVSLNNTGANAVALKDINDVVLGTSSVGGTLAITSGSITQTGILTVPGATTLTATAPSTDIDLSTQANILTGPVSIAGTASNVRDFKLRNTSTSTTPSNFVVGNLTGTSLRDLTITYNNAAYIIPTLTMATLRNIAITAGGAITQATGGIVQGSSATTASFTTGAFGIALTDTSNNFIGAVSLSNTGTANAVAVTDANALILGTSTIGGDFNIITGAGGVTGGLTQTTGALTVGGATTLTSSAGSTDIDLSTAANSLTGSVTIAGTASNVRDFKLRNTSATAGAVVSLGNSTTTSLRDLTITYNSAAYEIPTLRMASLRDIVITAGGAITQATGGVVQGSSATTASFTTGAFGITLTDTSNNFIGAVSLTNTGNNAVAVTDINAITLGTSSVGTGTLTVNANADPLQTGGITQGALTTITQAAGAGAATFNAGAGVITLVGAGNNNFTGAVSLNNSGANAVAVTDVNAITLGSSLVGSGTFAVNAVGITQAAGTTITQTTGAGAASFNAGAGVITLVGAGANDFTGAVSLNNSGANNVSVTDANALILAASSVGTGTLTINANADPLQLGGITQTGAITQAENAGAATFNAGAGVLTLTQNNDFTGAVSLNNTGIANAVAVTDANALILGTSTIGGDFAIITGAGTVTGGLTQTTGALTVGGSTTLTSSAGSTDIDLSTAANSLTGAVTIAGTASKVRDFKLRNTSSTAGAVVNLGNSTTTSLRDLTITYNNALYRLPTFTTVSSLRNIAITAGGSITQTAGGIVQGVAGATASFSTGSFTITLTQAANDFTGVVTLSNSGANAVAVTDANALILGTSTIGGDFDIITGAGGVTGGLTQTTGALTVGGSTTLTSSAGSTDIDLSTAANSLTGSVTIAGTASNVRDFKLRNTSTTAGAVVNLGNSTTTSLRDLTITYNRAAYQIPTFTTVTSLRNIAITAGGAITQATGGIVQGSSATTASFTTGAFGITLTDTSNNFIGAVSLINTGANAVAVTDANALILAASSVGTGTLTINANADPLQLGGITQTGAITQAGAGAVTFNGGAGVITLDQANDFKGAVSLANTGNNNVAVTDANAIILGYSSVGATGTGNFTVTSGAELETGGITQGGVLTVTGTTTLNSLAGSSDIDLSTQLNNLTGSVTIGLGTASNVRDFKLRNTSATAATVVNLGNSTDNLRDLTITYDNAAYVVPTFTTVASLRNIAISSGLTVGGGITQAAGGIVQGVSGTASFSTVNSAITLTDLGNNFLGAVSLNNSGAFNVSVSDANAIILGTSTVGTGGTGNLTVNATGANSITQNGVLTVTGTSSFTTGAGVITLTQAANDFKGAVSLNNTGTANAVAVTDANALILGTSTIGGDLNIITGAGLVASSGGLTQTGALTVGGSTTLTSSALSTDIDLSTAANSLTGVAGVVTIAGTASNLRDFKLRNTSATAGAVVNLGNSTTTSLRDLTISYNSAAYQVPTFTTVASLRDIAITAGGAITQATGGIVQGSSATTASFTTGAFGITLTDTSNNFTGAVSLTNTDAASAVQITDQNALTLGTLSIVGSLTSQANGALNLGQGSIGGSLTANSFRNGVGASGAITQAGALTVTGTSSLTAGANAITLTQAANNFIQAVSLNNSGANNVAVRDANAIIIGSSSVGTGTLTVTSLGTTTPTAGITQTGAITQAASAGAATFNGGAGVIRLTQPLNDFTGAVSLINTGANDVAVTDRSTLILGASSLGTGSLTVNAEGITQIAALTVPGAATFNGGGGVITLSQTLNDFIGAVSLNNTGNNAVAVTDANAITLGSSLVGSGTFAVNAVGITQAAGTTITQTAGLGTAAATFNAGAGVITLVGAGANDFTGAVSLNNSGANNVSVTDANALILAASSVGTGTLTVTSLGTTTPTAGITQTGAITQAASAGAATFNGGAGVIRLTQPLNDFTGAVSLINTGANDVAVTDRSALILGASSLGTGSLTVNAEGITQSGAITQTANAGTATFNAGTGDITMTASSNIYTGDVSITAANADFLMSAANGINRLGKTAGSLVVSGVFTLRAPTSTATFNLANGAGVYELSTAQLNNFSVGTLAPTTSGTLGAGNITIGTFNFSGVKNLSLTTTGTGNITANGGITGQTFSMNSGGSATFAVPNQIQNLGTTVVRSGGLTFQNQNGLNLTGAASMPGRLSLEVAGQFYNQTGVESPFANVAGGSVIKSLSLVGGLPNSVSSLAGFSYRYDGVMPTAGNVMTFAVPPLTMFAPSGTVVAGVDLSGTQTGGGQLNTFLTGSDDLNWIISDFEKFNLPKVSSAGLEYTIYPKRIESETRTLPDSTLSQLKQELGRPPTIDEINRREVSMRESNQLRSGSILERSSFDSTEQRIETQENAKSSTPLPTEGQVPQANQVPKKATSPDNKSMEALPPVAASGRLPSGAAQGDGKGTETARELLMKERASAEVGLSIPVAHTQ